MDVPVEVSPGKFVGSFGTEKTVVLPSGVIIVKLVSSGPGVRGEKDLGKVCVLSEVEEAIHADSGCVFGERGCERVVLMSTGWDVLAVLEVVASTNEVAW